MNKIHLQIARFSQQISIGFLLVLMLLIYSCEKGETGPAGANGANGSSNIQSFTFISIDSNWVLNVAQRSFTYTYSNSSITSDVVDNGTIQLFISDTSSNQWGALPYSISTLQFNYSYKLGEVVITHTLSNGSIPNNPNSLKFKLVVIPPSGKNSNINLQDYSEIKECN